MQCPRPTASKSVSNVCHLCSVVVCGCSILQASHVQRLSLPAMGSVWFLAWIWWVLNWCALVCLWNETCHHLPQNKALKHSLVGGHVVCSDLCQSSGVWDHLVGTEDSMTKRKVLPEHQGQVLDGCKLGSQCWHCTATNHQILNNIGSKQRSQGNLENTSMKVKMKNNETYRMTLKQCSVENI